MRTKHNPLILLLVLLIYSFGSITSLASETTSSAAELVQLLNSTQSMQADFAQFAVKQGNRGQSGVSTITGKMALDRPGKFRWEILQPNKQLIVAAKNIVWIYDADLAQVTKRKIDYRQPGNPAMLLSGSTATIQKMFIIKKLPSTNDDSGVWFKLQPRTETNLYQWIKLHFRAGQLVAMVIADNLGQQSKIQFSKILINKQLPSSLFNFTVPKGVDVIGLD